MATGTADSMGLTAGSITVETPHTITGAAVFQNSFMAFITGNIRVGSDVSAWSTIGGFSPRPYTGFYVNCASDNPAVGGKSLYLSIDGEISAGANQIPSGTYLRFSAMYFKK